MKVRIFIFALAAVAFTYVTLGGPSISIGSISIDDSSAGWSGDTYHVPLAQGSANIRRGNSAWFLYLENAGIFESPLFYEGRYSIVFDGGSQNTDLQVFLAGQNTLASGGIDAYNCSLMAIHGPGSLSIASANWGARALYSDGALWIGEGAALTIAHAGGGGLLAEKAAIYAVNAISIVGSTLSVVQQWSKYSHDRHSAIDGASLTIAGSIVAIYGGGLWADAGVLISHSCVSIMNCGMAHGIYGTDVTIDTAIVGIANNGVALEAKEKLSIENTQGAFISDDYAIVANILSLQSGNTLSIARNVAALSSYDDGYEYKAAIRQYSGADSFVHSGGKTSILAPEGTAIAASGPFCMSGGELMIVSDPNELDLGKFWKASYLASAAATILEQGVSPQAALSALTTFFESNLIAAYIELCTASLASEKPECGILSHEITIKGGKTSVLCETDEEAIGYSWSSISKTGGTVLVNGKSWPFSKAVKHKVAFNANGGNGKMDAQMFSYGIAYKLSKNVFTKKGYVFAGWAISKAKAKKGIVAYANGATVKNLRTDGGTTTLYAVWAEPKYKVRFYANGGKGKMAVQIIKYGKAAKLKASKFKRKGYVFKGWATSKANAKNGKVAYKNKAKVKNLITTGKAVKLYAVWKKK